MKTLLYTAVLTGFLSFFCLKTFAQKLSVMNGQAVTEEGIEMDCWTAYLDQDVEYCQKSFDAFMDKSFAYKTYKRAKGIYSVDKKRFSEITALRLDVRAIFNKESGGASVSFIFSPGYDVYLSTTTYSDDFQKAEKLVKNYVRFHYNAYYTKLNESYASKIKDRENDIKSNENKIDKLREYISANEAKISAADPGADKLKDKNSRYQKEIEEKTASIIASRTEIAKLQENIITANESLKKVSAYE